MPISQFLKHLLGDDICIYAMVELQPCFNLCLRLEEVKDPDDPHPASNGPEVLDEVRGKCIVAPSFFRADGEYLSSRPITS